MIRSSVFFTVWSPCQDQIGVDVGPDFLNPDDTVRDVLEQFDLISGIVEQNNQVGLTRLDDHRSHLHQTFSLATTAEEMENAFSEGKIGVMLGMEGWVPREVAIVDHSSNSAPGPTCWATLWQP